MLKKIWLWIVTSSADPTKISLTIKGIGMSIIAIITLVYGNALSPDLNTFLSSLIGLVQDVLIVISAVMTTWGLMRKIVLTVFGTNHQMPQ